MKILVISQYYYPEQFRVNDICEELVRRGHEVIVLTGIPNYPEGEIYKGYEDSYKIEDVRNGVHILRCNNRPRHKGVFDLLRNYSSYIFEANKRIKDVRGEFDVVYVYQMSPVTMCLPAIKFKRKNKTPIYLYCLDIWPESIRELPNGKLLSKRNLFFWITKLVSKYIYNSVDMIAVKCEQFKTYLHGENGVDTKKIKLHYEHAEASYLSVSEIPQHDGCFDFMFLGNIGHSSACEDIIHAANLLDRKKKFKVHFVGDGSALDRLKSLVKTYQMQDKILFHGRHPVSEINKFYEIADCCMLTLSNKTAIGLTPPAKLAGYMAASRAIIAAADGATRDIIQESGCGICIKPGDIEELARAMTYVIDNESEFIKKGKLGRDYFVQNFTLKTHVDRLEINLKQLVKGDQL